MSQIVARWTDWSASGLDYLLLDEHPEAITAHGVVLSGSGDRLFAARYQIICDPGWRVRLFEVELIGDGSISSRPVSRDRGSPYSRAGVDGEPKSAALHVHREKRQVPLRIARY